MVAYPNAQQHGHALEFADPDAIQILSMYNILLDHRADAAPAKCFLADVAVRHGEVLKSWAGTGLT